MNSMPTIKITIKDAVEAGIKNGYQHYHAGWFKVDHNQEYYSAPVKAACFMGQAGLNLGTDDSIGQVFNSVYVPNKVLDEFTYRNEFANHLDADFATWEEFKKHYENYENDPAISTFWTFIVFLNDEMELPYSKISEWVQKAYDALEPEIQNKVFKILKRPRVIDPTAYVRG